MRYPKPTATPASSRRQALLLCLTMLSIAAAHSQQQASSSIAGSASANPLQLAANYGKLPLSFEANQGQTDSRVKFLSQGNGYSLFLTNKSAVLALTKSNLTDSKTIRANKSGCPIPGDGCIAALSGRAQKPASSTAKTDIVRMELSGASPTTQVEATDQLPGTANYFIGNDPAKWHRSVPTYAKVGYKSVYPGVDLVYYGNQRQLEYDFVVAPGADPKSVKLHFAGAQKLRLTPEGALRIVAKNGEVAFHKPVVYQLRTSRQVSESASRREKVDGNFVLLAGNTIGFKVGSYDRGRQLVIDPTLAYSTYLGGAGSDSANAIAVDSTGHAYVTGYTFSAKFPTVDPYQKTNHDTASGVAFVTKLNSGGTGLVYSTYLGGSSGCGGVPQNATIGGDVGNGIAVNADGEAYIAGQACSHDFPLKDPYQSTNNGGANVFVTKLSATGDALVFSTYLGGSSYDYAQGIAVDASGEAFIAGQTFSGNSFPHTAGAFQTSTTDVSNTAFVTKFNAKGSALEYSTFLGDGYSDAAYAIAIDSSGDAYVTGYTFSGFPLTANAYQTSYKGNGAPDPNAFVTELNPHGNGLIYSTYLGGNYFDLGLGIAADGAGGVYVTGVTASTTFPVTSGAFQSSNKAGLGNPTGFVSKFDTASGALIYSTYLGGSVSEQGNSIAVDAKGDAYIAGLTRSYASASTTGFPVTGNAYQSANNAPGKATNAFLTELKPAGNALVYSTYLGGAGNASGNGDNGHGIALDSLGNPYIAGYAYSKNFPTLKTSYRPATKAATGNSNAFISRFVFHTATTTTVTSDDTSPQYGQTVVFTAYVPGKAGSEIKPTGTVAFSMDGGTPVPVTLDDTGHAEFSTSALAVGSHTITAAYSGDVNYFPSSGSHPETVSLASTSTRLTSAPNPSTVSEAVTFTSMVTAASGPTPTGTVSFYHGGTLIGTGTLSSGVAVLSYSGLAAGDHSMTARYSGSSTDAASTSAALSQVVDPSAARSAKTLADTTGSSPSSAAEGRSLRPAVKIVPSPTTTTASSSANPSVLGQAVIFRAAVQPARGTTPSGTVTFRNGSLVLGAATLNGGVAALSTNTLSVGTHSITATYNGGYGDQASVSAAFAQVVTP